MLRHVMPTERSARIRGARWDVKGDPGYEISAFRVRLSGETLQLRSMIDVVDKCCHVTLDAADYSDTTHPFPRVAPMPSDTEALRHTDRCSWMTALPEMIHDLLDAPEVATLVMERDPRATIVVVRREEPVPLRGDPWRRPLRG